MASEDTARRLRVLSQARTRVGIPYRIDPPPDGINNLDCSLYVLVTFRDAGLPFPAAVRTAEQMRQVCDPVVDWAAVLPGDLVFFEGTYDSSEAAGPDGHVATHIGISLGAGTQRMWDSHESTNPARPDGVGETDLSTPYWQEHIFEARRPRQYASESLGGSPPDPPAASLGGSPPAEAPAPVVFRVTDSGVRLRSGPGTGQPILIADIPLDVSLAALPEPAAEADGHSWRKVRTAQGTEGWVAAEFLRRAETGPELTNEPDHTFTFAALWPRIQAAAEQYGADPRVLAALIAQESTFKNWRVHADGTGHGLIGLDDNGLLPDFEQWAGISVGRGQNATPIPPGLQIDYCARTLAASARTFGSALNAARVWHRGPGLWQDARGDFYESRIRAHIEELFG